MVEVKPGEPLAYMQDVDGAGLEAAAAHASGQESDSGVSASSRGRKAKKEKKGGKAEWRPSARLRSLSTGPSSQRKKKTQRPVASPRRMQTKPRERTMPVMKTPLKDILHKQREREEEEEEEDQSEHGDPDHALYPILCQPDSALSVKLIQSCTYSDLFTCSFLMLRSLPRSQNQGGPRSQGQRLRLLS